MTNHQVTLECIDSVNWARGGVLMDERDDPETELAPTRSADVTPLAWSADEDDGDETLLYPDTGSLFTDDDAREYASTTVKMFVGLMAVVVAACVWLAVAWLHHSPDASPAPATQTAAAPILPSPDDKIVPAPAPPPVASPPLTVEEQYLAALRSDHISSAGGDSNSLGIAHAVCRTRDQGWSLDRIATAIQQGNPQLTGEAAQFIMTAAIHYFCPPPVGK
jgi:hypothetical protein